LGELENSFQDYSQRKYVRLMDWLKENKFYLTQTDCKRIIKCIGRQQDIGKSGFEVGYISIVYAEFKPSPEMNDEYYL